MTRKYIGGLLVTLIIFIVLTTVVLGQNNIVITLGEDLNTEQQQQMLNMFGVQGGNVRILTVSNQEEREYLSGLIPEERIGTRAISSAYVEEGSNGEGIQIETYNIDWVTKEMYENALTTAGVKDAKVIAAAPFNVSGTAALTGILKAFEAVTGQAIPVEQKQIANEEMVTTGELGEDIGTDNASRLIREIKEIIIEKNITETEEIRRVVIEVAGRLNIELTIEQVNNITELMSKIIRLDLNINQVREQLGEITRQNEEVMSFFDRIIEMIRRLFESILGMLNKLTGNN
ncbi:DUF1002 domain-containing protein [Alkaliphilus peptidifermentans]|uniref:Uncharacterized protein YpuA, DUF1002 family n=1 Tax=Alkaliphilus peptidifermentans DSM 18978 TaxID=1120976 RepID=A0A1G5LBY3_9FIRM|nr:DUF1002 domain-containing protein [Alkaliphilus peptidifermentans]SCZ09818.1 Uncharacterized protein YpuA, DUF1002 family [Alkaliphilus peptidifermentans DSM 18978]